MRRILVAVLRLVLRIFFRRIELAGAAKIPPEPRPALFVLNHPNALLDPLFILCLAPRRVSFLAKSTIFKMPVLGAIARGLECLPVYRHQDQGEDPKRNDETFAAARGLLERGGTIAIFPEGTTHDEPALKPVKSGAARIALSARARLDSLDVVPVGLYYTDKKTFRSKVLVLCADPIPVDRVALEPSGEPPREPVAALSRRIDEALRAVTLNAEDHEALDLVGRAERIFSSEPDPADEAARLSLARELGVRRRFQEGHALFREREPRALEGLEARIAHYEQALQAAGGLDPRTLAPSFPAGAVLRFALLRALALGLVAPLAGLGILLHSPAYRLTGFLARRFSGGEDVMVGTVKVLAALLLFPLTWAACALAAGLARGLPAGLLALAVAPALAWLGLRFGEIAEGTLAATRAFLAFAARPRFYRLLLEERRAIREEILRMGEQLERSAAGSPAAAAPGSGTGLPGGAPPP